MMYLPSNFIGFCYSSDDFYWDKKTYSFSADISEVPAVLRQMTNDSMDIGFAMRSSKTGEIAYFIVSRAERDADGDMYRWTFIPTDASIYSNPLLTGVMVNVYND